LPDAIGSHACECGHPEMRRLADGVLWCPGCGLEVVPFSASEMHSESDLTSEAYRCGWTEGLLGSTQSFVHNGGLPDGKMPTTGSPTTRDIGQAEQFAFSVVQGRPTLCR
jgi:hypothetical protein